MRNWVGGVMIVGLSLLVIMGNRLCAQSVEPNPSILMLLAPKDTIVPGMTRIDTLFTTDYLVRAGRRVSAWAFEARSNRRYQIDLSSDAFDPYLYVVGPGIVSLPDDLYAITDDDGGMELDASLCFTAPMDGMYKLIASALYGETGDYIISVSDGCRDRQGDRGIVGAIGELALSGQLQIGYEAEGVLTANDAAVEGMRVQAWTFEGGSDETLIVEAESDNFDTMIVVEGAGSEGYDDDGGVGTNSRLVFQAEAGQRYRVIVGSLFAGTGTFRIKILRRAPVQ